MPRKKRSRKKGSRVCWKRGRAYGDFRDYGDVGSGREALVAPGASLATMDPDVADRLAAERVAHLERLRRSKGLLGVTGTILGDYAAHHLAEKARIEDVTRSWLEGTEQRLRTWIDFLGADTPLDAIGVRDVKAVLGRLAERGLSASTQRHYLNALSNLYLRAGEDERVLPGYNPAGASGLAACQRLSQSGSHSRCGGAV